MKKRLLATLLACAMTATLLAGCGGGTDDAASTTTETTTDAEAAEETTDAAEETTDAAETEDAAETTETADAADEHVRYDDIKAELGPIPAAAKDMTFNIGFCGKAFENEFWRMEKEGAEAAAQALQDLGLDVTVTAQAAAGPEDGKQQGHNAIKPDIKSKDSSAHEKTPRFQIPVLRYEKSSPFTKRQTLHARGCSNSVRSGNI